MAAGGKLGLKDWLAPALGLLVYLLAGKAAGAWVGALLAVFLLGSVLAAVRHAETIAHRLGEPFGTLVLTLAVTVIEVSLIVSLMLSGDPNPYLARDSVQAVVVLVLHGLAGACILIAALRHSQPEFRTEGANAFLTVLLPMTALVLILPNHVISVDGPYFSPLQLGFVSVACLTLYGAFLFVQTVRHPEFFMPLGLGTEHEGEPPTARWGWIGFALLILSLVAVVLLAKALAPFITAGVAAVGAPLAITGVIVAAIVLMPESASAIRAAMGNRLQSSINLALGSALACIGLTIPTVAAVSFWLDQPLALGVDAESTLLLALSFLTAIFTYGMGRTNMLAGFVHLVLFATWVFMIFAP